MSGLSPSQRRRAALAVSFAIGAFLVAHSFNAFVAEALYMPPGRAAGMEPAGQRPIAAVPSSAQQWAEDIRNSGLFQLPAVPVGMAPGPGGSLGAPMRASIGAAAKIRLIGVVFGDQRGVFAIVEEIGSKRQSLYRLHDEIPDVGEVSEIRPGGMVVRLGHLEELLELTTVEKPVPPAVSNSAASSQGSGAPLHRVIDRREVESAMSDLPKLLTQARAVPNMVNGALNGFRIDYIAPASFYEKIGIRSGDVLQRVNGIEIRDPTTMLNLFQQLKNERVVKLDMVRNNQRSTITYELR